MPQTSSPWTCDEGQIRKLPMCVYVVGLQIDSLNERVWIGVANEGRKMGSRGCSLAVKTATRRRKRRKRGRENTAHHASKWTKYLHFYFQQSDRFWLQMKHIFKILKTLFFPTGPRFSNAESTEFPLIRLSQIHQVIIHNHSKSFYNTCISKC